jgi:hypothetical protein
MIYKMEQGKSKKNLLNHIVYFILNYFNNKLHELYIMQFECDVILCASIDASVHNIGEFTFTYMNMILINFCVRFSFSVFQAVIFISNKHKTQLIAITLKFIHIERQSINPPLFNPLWKGLFPFTFPELIFSAHMI